MNSIYKQLDRIDDSKSLNEKWNVKNQRELKKLINESIEGADEAIDFAREYVLDQHSYNDYDFDETDTEFTMTLWCGGSYFDDDESEVKYKMNIQKLVELKDDEKAFEDYIDSCQDYIDYEAVGDDFYERAAEELNKHFGCTGAFLEPSTQLRQGRTFLFADDMEFDGSFDFQTSEDYIRNDDFEGFLNLCKDSFTVVKNEDIIEEDLLLEDTRAQLIKKIKKDLNGANVAITASDGNVHIHSNSTGADYDILFDKTSEVASTSAGYSKKRFTGNGTIVNGDIIDSTGANLGPAFVGSPLTSNRYHYTIRSNDVKMPQTYDQMIAGLKADAL